MSDDTPHGERDPIDKAYVEAEAVLSDEAARAARRARVLAAVAADAAATPVTPAAPAAPDNVVRPSVWRRNGGWLAAACVAGLGMIVVLRIYPQPPPLRDTSAAALKAPAAAAPAAAADASAPASAPAPSPPPVEPRPAMIAPPTTTVAPASPIVSAPASPVMNEPPAPPPPPPESSAQVEASRRESRLEAAPAPPPPAALAAGPSRDSGNDKLADARGARGELDEQSRQSPGSVMRAAPKANAAPGYGGMAPADGAAANRADKPADLSDRLRAAAAAGRASEVKTLLEQGAIVDAADARGDTALIKAVRAGQPAVAAVLRRHGASLDRRNHAGESARGLAADRGDPALNRALGL